MAMPRLITRQRVAGLGIVTLAAVLQGGAAGASALAVRGLFNALHHGQTLAPALLALLAGSGMVIGLARVLSAVTGQRIGHAYALEVRHALFHHASRMSASDVALRRNGYMSLRFVGDLSALRNWLALGLPHLIAALILIPVAQGVLWNLHPGIGRAVAPFFALGFLLIGLGGLRLAPLHRRLRRQRARIAADMAERMPLAPHLGRMGRAQKEIAQINRHSQQMISAALAQTRMSEGLKAVPDMVSGLAALAVIWVGMHNTLAPGTIAAALAALGIAFVPMRELANVWNLRASYRAAYAKCDSALNRRHRPQAHVVAQKAGAVGVDIRGLNSGALRDFSLSANAGEIVPVSGMTALEEAELFSVLLGLEIPEGGQVHLNNTPLPETDQSAIALIDTQPPLLRGSLRRGVVMGISPRPHDKAIRAAARKTGFDAVISRLGGLDQQIAEGGRNLSITERAQLSFTRAMLAEPGLVLLARSAIRLDTALAAKIITWARSSGATVLHENITPDPICPNSRASP